jgi:transcriptional regulator with XRE-family HTH domain
MKKTSKSEKILIEEISEFAKKLQRLTRGLTIGELIKLIRIQLGMSQDALSKRASVPQSTVSRVEGSEKTPTLATLAKILDALSCDLVIAPSLKDPIDIVRSKQAKKKANEKISYLRGTMNLENQEPDKKLIRELIKEEEGKLLHGSSSKLWKK